MNKKNDFIILILVAAAIVGAYFYLDVENSLFGDVIDKVTPINFDEVHARNIVKNSLPIFLLEENDNSCKVKAELFSSITEHSYFIRSQELVDKLQYNDDEKTLIFPCDKIPDEKSRLEIWYVTTESDKHAEKYDYWITPWTDNVTPDS